MKKIIFILLLLPIVVFSQITFTGKVNKTPKIYYISTSGNNSSSGLTTGLSWATLTYAVSYLSPVVAGDYIFVKAGNYGAENVLFQKSGTANDPINIIGYKIIPGSLTSPSDQPPLLVNAVDPYAAYITTDMPTFNGGNRTTGIGFDMRNSENIILRNFQIEQYSIGVILGSADTLAVTNISLYNIGCKTIGNTTSSYSGQGLLCGNIENNFSNYSTIEKCQIVNCCAELIQVCGNYNNIKNTKVFCNENTSNASADYYVTLFGSYNKVTGCYAYRLPGISASGHGFTIKSNAEDVIDAAGSYALIYPKYNEIINCTAENMGESFCVRHRWVTNNTFYKCTATGTYAGTYLGSSGEGNGITIRDGAANNIFNSIYVSGCASGITFQDTGEDGDTGGSPPGHPGSGNKVINSIFNICYVGINFDDYNVASDAGTNTIANCNFYKCDYVHYAARRCENMVYKNNIYSTAQGYFRGSTYSTDVASSQFTYSDFYSVSIPGGFVAGTNIGSNPLFISTTDFHISNSSPCKNTGTALSYILFDFSGRRKIISIAPSMGAYER